MGVYRIIAILSIILPLGSAHATSPARPSDCIQFELTQIPYNSPNYKHVKDHAVSDFSQQGWKCGIAQYVDCFKTVDKPDRVEALFLGDACYTNSATTFAITYVTYSASKYDDEVFIDIDSVRVAKARFYQLEKA